MKVTFKWIVEATLIDKVSGKIKSTHRTTNTLVETWENFVAGVLNKSFLLSLLHDNLAPNFVDYMSIGAWYKLLASSSNNTTIHLPYNPTDVGWEAVDFYDGCTVYCISGPNQWLNRAVAVNGYNSVTKILTVDTPWLNVPLAGEVYVVSTATKEVQLNGEGMADEDGHTMVNTKKAIDYNQLHTTPLTNEVEMRAEWIESDWEYIVWEAGLRYNLAAATPGNSWTHTHPGKLFARATFANNPPHKTINDVLQVRWTLRVGVDRTP